VNSSQRTNERGEREYSVTVTGFGRTSTQRYWATSAADAHRQALDRNGIAVTVRKVHDPTHADYPWRE
jgi:hypothetical protein